METLGAPLVDVLREVRAAEQATRRAWVYADLGVVQGARQRAWHEWSQADKRLRGTYEVTAASVRPLSPAATP
jgi:hypothetical protein